MASFHPSQSPRSLDALVGYQVRRWDLEEEKRAPRGPLPCVAMSRLPYSGAAEVGRKVAERLGFGFFGIEIVDQIAREQGIQRDLVEGVDERVRSAIDRWVVDAFRQRPFNESDYLRGVVRTVATLGERGLAVILGRGSPFILGEARTLRVLVVAPRQWRIARRLEEEGGSAEEAEERIELDDESRIRFLRADFKVEPNDPGLYDLVVNTATLGFDGAAELMVEALARKFPAFRPGA
ncbi:MAG: cytidylate kinase-like family protein [Myxococcota bacterium]